MADLRLLGKNTVGNQPIAHLLIIGAHTAFHRQMCAQTRTGRLEDLFKVLCDVFGICRERTGSIACIGLECRSFFRSKSKS